MRGYHIYKDIWAAVVGEEFPCKLEISYVKIFCTLKFFYFPYLEPSYKIYQNSPLCGSYMLWLRVNCLIETT